MRATQGKEKVGERAASARVTKKSPLGCAKRDAHVPARDLGSEFSDASNKCACARWPRRGNTPEPISTRMPSPFRLSANSSAENWPSSCSAAALCCASVAMAPASCTGSPLPLRQGCWEAPVQYW